MDSVRRTNNVGKPIPKSNKEVSQRKNAVPAARNLPVRANNAAQSISARGPSPKRKSAPVKKSGAKKSGAVVGMKKRYASSMRPVRTPKIINVRKKERTPFPIATIFLSVMITALLLFMMMSYAEIDKYNSQINDCNVKLTKMEQEKDNLSVKLDKKDDLVYIEKYATEELGMVKSEMLPRKTVHLNPEDKSKILKYDDGKEDGFGFLLAGIGEVINGFMNK